MSGTAKKKKSASRLKRWAAKSLRILALMALAVMLLTVLQVLSLRFVNPLMTVRMAVFGTLAGLGGMEYRMPVYIWTPIDDISPQLQRAVLAGEDQRFLAHHGFDWTEIREATHDLMDRGRLRGASTISMQTARTVFLLPSKSVWRKAAEGYYTVLIELLWSKRRILEIYLNTVDWGNGIMGAEAAARRYCHRSARQLSAGQAAALAAILPNPHLFKPFGRQPFIQKRRSFISAYMRLMVLPR